jgi:hypothetical protein
MISTALHLIQVVYDVVVRDLYMPQGGLATHRIICLEIDHLNYQVLNNFDSQKEIFADPSCRGFLCPLSFAVECHVPKVFCQSLEHHAREEISRRVHSHSQFAMLGEAQHTQL